MKITKKQILKLERYLWVKDQPSRDELKYIKKAMRYASVFRHIPWIRMIGLWNSLAMNAWNKDSDIDLFVVTAKDALWFVRIVMTLCVSILRKRKTKNNHAGKFCLSFFCTEDVFDFSTIAIKDDVYLYYRILTMKPIIIYWDVYERFITANDWVDYEQFLEIHSDALKYLSFRWTRGLEVGAIIQLLNKLCKKVFEPRSQRTFEKKWRPFWVIISVDMLKFHDADARSQISKIVFEKS